MHRRLYKQASFFFNLVCKTVTYLAIQNSVVTTHATKFNIINFHVFPTDCIYVIRMILKILTNYIHTNTFNIIKSRIFPAEYIRESNYFKNNHQVFM